MRRQKQSWARCRRGHSGGQAAAGGASGEAEAWVEKTKAEAHRWVLEAPDIALPSEVQKSYQAILAAHGRPNWWMKVGTTSECTFTASEKLRLLTIAHATDLGHGGGRIALIHEMKRALGSKLWCNAELDAEWLCTRCETCRSHTCKDMCAEPPRSLPRPDACAAFEIVLLSLLKTYKGTAIQVTRNINIVEIISIARCCWRNRRVGPQAGGGCWRATLVHVAGGGLCHEPLLGMGLGRW